MCFCKVIDMDRKKALLLCAAGALGQIWAVCAVVFILRRLGFAADNTTAAGMIAVGVGGVSSALWGSVAAIKYRKCGFGQIIKDFFNVKQSPKSYLSAVMFLLLDFLYVAFGGHINIDAWYVPFVLFIESLLFGGIEEICWRYFFQPTLQERHSYIISTLITFAVWGIWHFSYFYIWGNLGQIQVVGFLTGLLVNSFILSALYVRTKSLWICVMTHSMINVLTQITSDGSTTASVICKAGIIGLAIFLSSSAQKADKETPLHKTDLS